MHIDIKHHAYMYMCICMCTYTLCVSDVDCVSFFIYFTAGNNAISLLQQKRTPGDSNEPSSGGASPLPKKPRQSAVKVREAPDRSTMTMQELIYYNPSANPMRYCVHVHTHVHVQCNDYEQCAIKACAMYMYIYVHKCTLQR